MSDDIEEPVSATAWRIFKGDWKMYRTMSGGCRNCGDPSY